MFFIARANIKSYLNKTPKLLIASLPQQASFTSPISPVSQQLLSRSPSP